MVTQNALSESKQNQSAAEKLQQLRKLFAGAPELARKALENAIPKHVSAVGQ